MTTLLETLKTILRDVDLFARHASGVRLRAYQVEAARGICESVIQGRGLTFVVIFPRQSGKNELQANLEAYLLTLLSQTDAELVKVSPTWKPQSQNAMRRLERLLKRNLIAGGLWSKESGYIYKVGNARITFLSGAPTSSIVGATASTLLECDEAQDVRIEKWDKEVAPMAASSNATRVFYGTAWTNQTLLAREYRAALAAQAGDGVRRVFRLTADDVAREVPAYGRFVQGEIARHGREHPFIRTQYYSEDLDEQGGMFPAERMARMRGTHPAESRPAADGLYAFLLDVGGEETQAETQVETQHAASLLPGFGEIFSNGRRDATALTIVRVDLSRLDDPGIRLPRYQVVQRRDWIGARHTDLYGQLTAMVEAWQPRYLVVDATGIGAGLAAFLRKALGKRVIPYEFNRASKSRLGWEFLGLIEGGRYAEYAAGGGEGERAQGEAARAEAMFAEWMQREQAALWKQLAACQMEIVPGPGRLMRWGVPDGWRDPLDGRLVHDDYVLSAALAAVLDRQAWGLGLSEVIEGRDPLKGLEF